MTTRPRRIIGDTFSPKESALLDILCGGTDAESEVARAQRATAARGGYELDECECFLISVGNVNKPPTIEHAGGPFAMAEVADGDQSLGLLELWVVDGLLHSVSYMPFGDGHSALPSPDDYTITLIQEPLPGSLI